MQAVTAILHSFQCMTQVCVRAEGGHFEHTFETFYRLH